jgi:putative peptide zinc metalloprotease protein
VSVYRPPPVRPDLIVNSQVHRGEPYVIVKDPVTRRFFRLPALAYQVAEYFNSAISVEQVSQEISAKTDCFIDAAEVERFARHLEGLGLLEQQLSTADIDARQRKLAGERRSLLYLKWPLVNPDPLLNRLLVVLRPLFTKPVMLAFGGLVLASLVVHVTHTEWVSQALHHATHGGGLLWLYGATALTLTLHELAHGLTSKRFGADVHEMGFLLLYFMPCAYTDISNAYLVNNKWERIWITLAGSVADLVIWAVASIVLVIVQPGMTGQQVLGAVMLTTGYRSVALNLNPLIKLDGYYVLLDLLEMPNLRQRSKSLIRWRVKQWLRRDAAVPDETPRDRRVLEVYGWLSATYVVGLLFLSALWFDNWLTGWAGSYGRLAYLAIGVLILIGRWVVKAHRHRRLSTAMPKDVETEV